MKFPSVKMNEIMYSAMHGFWLVKFWNSTLEPNHLCSDKIMFGLALCFLSPYVQFTLSHWSSRQINTHPLPFHHTKYPCLPAPLTLPPAKNEATNYTVLCSLVGVSEETVSSYMRVWSQYVGNYLVDYMLW